MYNNDNFEKLKKRIDKCRNCYIQWPAGPPGTEFVSSYGIRYSMSTTPIALLQGTDNIIPLPEKGAAFLTEYPDDNSIKIR